MAIAWASYYSSDPADNFQMRNKSKTTLMFHFYLIVERRTTVCVEKALKIDVEKSTVPSQC